MKLDPFAWSEVNLNEKIQAGKGILRVRCSAPAPLYVEAEGYEVLAEVGTSFEIDLSEAVTWRVDAPKGARIFWMPPPVTSHRPYGEVYTNIDRMPHESGQLAEVTRAMRMLELERRSVLKEIRSEAAALRAARDAAEKSVQPGIEAAPEQTEETGDAHETV
ncbi:hypothetical protein [Paracoccus alkenifer]|uniref:Uncharacterized protein n=1 Tax=Paracoccus alkenifer TaxID=65735 RepID=A0A1H6M008_9RHOB|nr:hypothetical protein [Paracoccus alkenifer]SEH91223.1 hypothetical protein SAMN04488075_1787 [Paracoccus alkenifer]